MKWKTSDRRSRLPADWPERRARVLRRDGWVCQIRSPGCQTTASDVDHVRRGDDHSDQNLRAACDSCHKKKSSSEGNSQQARLRALRKRPVERHPGRN